MKLLFLGDFFYDYTSITDDMETICDYIQENDYKVILNLESVLGHSGTPIKKGGPNLRGSNTTIEVLKRLNVVAVCMANNHAMDYGKLALSETIEMLESAEIACIGAGINKAKAETPLTLDFDGKQVIIQNYGWDIEETVYATSKKPGCAALQRKKVINNTKTLRENNSDSYIINIFHWGFEFNTLPMPSDIMLAHNCIEAGCNLIIGHHPHVVQPKECWHGHEIFYSLGNFFFGSKRNMYTLKFPLEVVENFCDYGVGVVYDLDTGNSSYLTIYYDKLSGNSKIVDNKQGVLKDITGMDWKGKDYERLAKEHAVNYNPILGVNENKNKLTIIKLKVMFLVADKVKFIKKTKLGMRIFDYFKSRCR